MMERLAFSTGERREVAPRDEAAAPAVVAAPPAVEAEETRDWTFTWTLFFTVVLFFRPQDIFPPLRVLHLAELSAIGGLASLVFGRLSRGQSITRMTPELAGVFAFAGVMLVTAPFSIWFGGSLNVFIDIYSKVVLVYLLTVNALTSPRRLETLTWVLVLVLGYIGLRAIIDFVRGVNTVAGGTRVRGSVGGVIENPNDLALNMVAFLPLATFIVLRPGGLVKRALALLCVVFMLGAIVASGSRGGFLGLVVMAAVMALYAVRERPGFVIGGVLALLCALPLVPGHYWERIASITNRSIDDRGSAEERETLIREAFQAFAENPLTGVGAGEFVNWKGNNRSAAWHEAHNVLLQVAAEMGIFGISVFLFLIFRGFMAVLETRRLVRRARASLSPPRRGSRRPAPPPAAIDAGSLTLLNAHSAAMMAALAGWLICALFASVAYSWTFYYLLTLAAAPREILRDRLGIHAHRSRAASPAALHAVTPGARA